MDVTKFSVDGVPINVADEQAREDITEIKSNLSQLYGVGAIWITLSNLDPNDFMDGTWEKVEGQFLLGSGSYTEGSTTYNYTVGATGGEATHTLTSDEVPETRLKGVNGWGVGSKDGTVQSNVTANWARGLGIWSGGMDSYYPRVAGGGQSHNNMPPYLVVNIWQRVA